MEIKRVRDRGDGVKQVTVPKDSEIDVGDYVKIEKIEGEARNIDHLGFDIICNHLESSEEKFADIPLEHSAEMAVCKECYIRMTPKDVLEDQGIEIPDEIEPGEFLE